jgi:hypothetical protein
MTWVRVTAFTLFFMNGLSTQPPNISVFPTGRLIAEIAEVEGNDEKALEAVGCLTESLTLKAAALEDYHLDCSQSHLNIGACLNRLAQFENARKHFGT